MRELETAEKKAQTTRGRKPEFDWRGESDREEGLSDTDGTAAQQQRGTMAETFHPKKFCQAQQTSQTEAKEKLQSTERPRKLPKIIFSESPTSLKIK